MIIIKNKTQDNFTVVPNSVLNDEKLSWKAKGILAYFMSKPSDWVIRERDLINKATENKAAYRTGVEELVKAGYITKSQSRAERGKYSETTIIIDFSPSTDFPSTDYRTTDNQPYTNTDSTKTDSTKYISYKKEYIEFLRIFNSIVGSSYKGSDKVLKQFSARLKEGYTLKEIATAIKNASNDSYLMGSNDSNKRYLTPEYILRANKLDQWLNAVPVKKTGFQLVS